MRRIVVALSASLLVLLSLVGPVAADWPGDPGTYKQFVLQHTECLDTECTQFNYQTVGADYQPDSSAQVVVVISTEGGPFETGCTSVAGSSLPTQGRYIVGVPTTVVALYDGGGCTGTFTRNVTVSASGVLLGVSSRESINTPVTDGDCAGRMSGKRVTFGASGSITIDGSALAAPDNGLSSVTDIRVTLRCPN